jgi:hypothetical protein
MAIPLSSQISRSERTIFTYLGSLERSCPVELPWNQPLTKKELIIRFLVVIFVKFELEVNQQNRYNFSPAIEKNSKYLPT